MHGADTLLKHMSKRSELYCDRESDEAIEPGERPKQQLRFLNFNHPAQARSSRARNAVRVHVTQRQHRQRKENERLAASAPRAWICSSAVDGWDLHQGFEADRPDTDIFTFAPASSTAAVAAQEYASDTTLIPRPQVVLPPPRLDLAFLPPKLRGFVLGAVEYYETVIAIPNDFICGSSRRNALRIDWPFFMMSDRTALLSMALNVSPFYAKASRGVTSHHDLPEVLYLEYLVARGMNQALSKPGPISDQLIFTVLGVGHYEYLSGKPAVCWLHLQAFYRMVCLRGGLQTLGLDGFLERAAIFMDFHLAHVTGREPVFDSYSLPSSQSRPRLDLKAFFGQSESF